MNDSYTTKKRELSAVNSIMEGYKKTNLGWIPEDWAVFKLHELGVFKNGINKSKENFGFGCPFINLNDMFRDKLVTTDLPLVNANRSELKQYSLLKGDILFVRSSVKSENVGLTKVIEYELSNTVFSGFIIRFRTNDKLNNDFKAHCFDEKNFRYRLLSKSTISANTNINQQALSSLGLIVPPIFDQKAIANCLNAWDATITKQTHLIAAKKQLKKALMQQLVTGNKRLPGFEGEWQTNRFDHFLKYSPRPVQKPDLPFTKLGIRSHCKGTFKNEDFEPADIAIETLYLVKPNDLIVNITFAWEGAVAIVKPEDKDALVSHRFPTYTFKENISDSKFFQQFIQSKRFRYLLELISPGGAGRNRVMSKKELDKLKIRIPFYKEQIAIAQVLESADHEIELLTSQLKQFKTQKKGLMQQLLTGKKRLKFLKNINEEDL